MSESGGGEQKRREAGTPGPQRAESRSTPAAPQGGITDTGRQKAIALPGYRPQTDGIRHRPPSVRRRVDSLRPPEVAAAEAAAAEPAAAETAVSATTGEPPALDSVSAPRSVRSLQAEAAASDVRLLARQLLSAPSQPPAERARAAPGPATDWAGRLEKTRIWLTALILVGLVFFGVVPVVREVIFASTQSALAEAVRAEAMRIGTDAGPGVIAGYVRERDLESLRALYARERPRVARALAGAGFDGLSEQEVSLRVDFRSGALIVAVTLDEGGDHILSAAANTEGSPVGHQTEVGADGGLARMGSLFWMLGVAGVLIAGVWLAPQLLRRRA